MRKTVENSSSKVGANDQNENIFGSMDSPPLIISKTPLDNPYFSKWLRSRARQADGEGNGWEVKSEDLGSRETLAGKLGSSIVKGVKNPRLIAERVSPFLWDSERKRPEFNARGARNLVLLSSVALASCSGLIQSESAEVGIDLASDDSAEADDACDWLAAAGFQGVNEGWPVGSYIQVYSDSLGDAESLANDINCWSDSLHSENSLLKGPDTLIGINYTNGADQAVDSQQVLGVATRTVDASGQFVENQSGVTDIVLLSFSPEHIQITSEGVAILPFMELGVEDNLIPSEEGGMLAVSSENGGFELRVNGDDELIPLSVEELSALGGDNLLGLLQIGIVQDEAQEEPEPTAEVAVIPTPAVTVDQGLPLEHFDGTNGEPIILWRERVAIDLMRALGDREIVLEGGINNVTILRDTDDNGIFRWMPIVDTQTEEGRVHFVGHLGKEYDYESGQNKDVLKGVCEVNVDKWIAKGIVQNVADLQLDVNYSEDSFGNKNPRYAVKVGDVSLMGCTDLRLGVDDRSLFVAFADRADSFTPSLFPDVPEGNWLRVVDGESGERLLMEDIGGDPSYAYKEGVGWVKVEEFIVDGGRLLSWNDEEWLMEEPEIPEEILGGLSEDAIFEDVSEGELGRWNVTVDGQVEFFVRRGRYNLIQVIPLPTATPTLEPTPIPPTPTETPIPPPPTATLEATQPPPPTAVPTEIPPTPEPVSVPPMIAGQIPTLEQISQCAAGVFPEAPNIPVISHDNGWPYGLVVGKGEGMTITVQEVFDGALTTLSVADAARFEFRQVIDRSRYPLKSNSKKHVITYNGEHFNTEQFFSSLPIGAHVWVFPEPSINGGKVVYMYCDAIQG